jgi:hypothetical protein
LNLLTESAHWRPSLDGLAFPCLDSSEAVWLERPFQEEIFQALLSMKVEKRRVRMAKSEWLHHCFFPFLLVHCEG